MRYDLAVIGSGQGGVPLALDFAKRGKRVVVFERGQLGGCCVNVGCTPSKAFLASAHAAGRARRASDVHVHCDVRVDVPAVMQRVQGIVGEWHDGVERKFARSSVELVRAEASFAAPHVVRAGGETYEADVVVIDTGGRANVPPIDGLGGTPFLTNENFFLQETLPRKLVVLGAGYIGLELGQGAARLGSAVTLVTPDDRIIGREESDVCSVLSRSFARDGIDVRLARRATKVAHDGTTFTVTLDDGTSLDGDGLLVAIGRRPNVPDGTTERAGIALDERGNIRCDEHLQTSVADHYALGDVAGQPQFTHVSWEDFRRLQAIIGGDRSRTRDDRVLAYAMYTEPQVGRVGLSADQASRARHRPSRRHAAARRRRARSGMEPRRRVLPLGRRPAERRHPRRHVRRVRGWGIDPRDPRPHGSPLDLARPRTLGARPPDLLRRSPDARPAAAVIDPDRLAELEHAREGDPFAVLGPHELGTGTVVRAFVPGARSVTIVDDDGKPLAVAEPVGDAGLLEALVLEMPAHYRLRIEDRRGTRTIEDPYRFGPLLGDLDVWLLGEGNHLELHRALGAHPDTIDGVHGTRFAVWAPNARRVSVVGDWNGWDGRVHPMRLRREAGVWELFVPDVAPGARYKYELIGAHGELLPLRADPVAFRSEVRPGNASVVTAPSSYEWHDAAWLEARGAKQRRDAPIQIYEVHLGSWRRVPEQGDRFLTYRELAEQLVPYAVEMGFTHIELLPVTEHPFDLSWGYQTTGWFAPTSRFGDADDFRAFVDAAHAAGLAVILDWVPGHFPTDAHALGNFDGTPLYEHADPREGYHREWGTYVFNLGRIEVANFLIASALYWLREFHLDGLRVDAVASLLYRDYSRKDGEWVPNVYGGRENLEAVAFLRRLNTTLYGLVPGIATFAEESTAWPGVTAPADVGGLGFGYKWNMGWMHDTLKFLERDPLFRSHHLNEISFGLIYAFSENFVLPLSHDEVVHGKRSLLGRMPGGDREQFASVRLLYAHMWAHPGKKLLFAGGEFAQRGEWRAQASLDWHVVHGAHQGVQTLVKDVNRIARSTPALHERDCEPAGFEWISYDDTRNGVIAYIRWDAAHDGHLICAVNFSGAQISGYRIGVPRNVTYREVLNTDAAAYGGSGVGNHGSVSASNHPSHGRPFSVTLTLPALAAIWLAP